jgi:Cft2 family RNA processing exonuclease
MKRISELSHDEIIKLTDEQINNFIDIEIAEEGIKPCPMPQSPTLENIGVVATEIFYKVGELLFPNKEDAIRVASMDIYTPQYNWQISYDFKWAEKNVDLKIEEVSFYKKEDILRSTGLIKARDSRKEQYKKEKEKYDKYLNSTASFRDSVWSIISEARNKEYSIQNAITAFKKFLQIADNDESVALRFFDKAFFDEPQEIKDIALRRLDIKAIVV